jgi:hypothetical protein
MKRKPLTEADMVTALAGLIAGSKVFISYYAGRCNDSDRAYQERERAIEEGIPLNHFTGTLESLKKTKAGQMLVTLFVEERDTLGPRGELTPGNYRAMNPSLGKMVEIRVLAPMKECWWAL